MAKKETPPLKKADYIAGFIVIIAFGLMVSYCSGGSGNSGVSEEDREKGFHCLSAWDGSHHDVVSQVKKQLRDPNSFEHISTRITPQNADGLHQIVMEYRSRNGFGGMMPGLARGIVRNDDCKAVLTFLE